MNKALKVSGIINKRPERVASDCLLVGVYKGSEKELDLFKSLGSHVSEHIAKLVREPEISGSLGISTMIYTLGHFVPTRIIFLGLGSKNSIDPDALKNILARTFRKCRALQLEQITVDLSSFCSGCLGPLEAAECFAGSAVMGLYVYDEFKTSKPKSFPQDINLVLRDKLFESQDVEEVIKQGIIIGESVNLARDLANAPANVMTPKKLSEIALYLAETTKLECEILEEEDMQKLSMGALIGVSRGSVQPAKLVCLNYKGNPNQSDSNVALIGKGITFDSGGLNLKAGLGMRNMKGDMAGGAAVIGAMKAIAELNLKVNVLGLIPATENMPGADAQKPGDVVQAMNSVTIEIDNTDAEGRLVLADALCFAEQRGFTRIIDIATLTGAVRTALGDKYIGIFGNDDDFTKEVMKAGQNQGEKMWELPTDDEYMGQLDSEVADIKNSGGPSAGSIIGAMFIKKFVDKSLWVHLDVAAVSRVNSIDGYQIRGATGVGVRSLVQFCKSMSSPL